MDATELDYCRQKARESDIDAYLAALFLREPQRRTIFAIEAFAGELKRIARNMREPMLAQIKLQWWREALERVGKGKPDAHPVLTALAPLLQGARLQLDSFASLIDAREAELASEASDPLGSAQALLRLKHEAIADPAHLPVEIIDQAARALAIGRALRLHQPYGGMEPHALCMRAGAHIEAVSKFVSKETLPLVLPLASLKLSLDRFARARFSADNAVLEPPIYQRQWAMLRAMWRGRL